MASPSRITAITLVHTIRLVPNQGARRRTAASSTTIVPAPARAVTASRAPLVARVPVFASPGVSAISLLDVLDHRSGEDPAPVAARRLVLDHLRSAALDRLFVRSAVDDELDGLVHVHQGVVQVDDE